MIRLSKLTDYGFVVLSLFARREAEIVLNARDASAESGLPMPTVSKLLKILARQGLLVATRGMKGGYRLSRRPEQITVAEIIGALEGPVAMTDCLSEHDNDCVIDGSCPCQGHWQLINSAVKQALEGITLAQMAKPVAEMGSVRKNAQPGVTSFSSERGGCACPGGGHVAEGSTPCSCSNDHQHQHKHRMEVEDAKQ